MGALAESAGKIQIKVQRKDDDLLATVMRGKGLKNMEVLGKNDVYAIVTVNGEEQRTVTLESAGTAPIWTEEMEWSTPDDSAAPVWSADGEGQALTFAASRPLKNIAVRCFDEDAGGVDTDDLIGECTLPLDDVVDRQLEAEQRDWQWPRDGSAGNGWRMIREADGEAVQALPDSATPLEGAVKLSSQPMRSKVATRREFDTFDTFDGDEASEEFANPLGHSVAGAGVDGEDATADV